MPRWIALSGTPGTGKTEVAARLMPTWEVVEVSEFSMRHGTARRRRRESLTVDLHRLARALRREKVPRPPAILVGHLAHLLPVRDVFLLRCHPRELDRRLTRRGEGRTARYANVVVEATDLILGEALARRRRVWEVDTTGRRPSEVARELAQLIRHRGRPRYGRFRWLEDPAVTAMLLRQGR